MSSVGGQTRTRDELGRQTRTRDELGHGSGNMGLVSFHEPCEEAVGSCVTEGVLTDGGYFHDEHDDTDAVVTADEEVHMPDIRK